MNNKSKTGFKYLIEGDTFIIDIGKDVFEPQTFDKKPNGKEGITILSQYLFNTFAPALIVYETQRILLTIPKIDSLKYQTTSLYRHITRYIFGTSNSETIISPRRPSTRSF
jgi:hypothetical protein